MNNDSILFLTKDAFYRGYLPIYGNTMWKTPNIDELAAKGSLFMNHHTGAPSTVMSNICMFTEKEAYECEMKDYVFTNKKYDGHTLWDRAENEGFECHIIWDETWKSHFKVADRLDCYGVNTKFHLLEDLKQGVGAHYKHEGFLKPNAALTEEVILKLENEIKSIFDNTNKKVFLWIHLPHVLNGFTGYGADIEAYDRIAGICRQYFTDENIFISADHGNMNGAKGKIGYGFDVYEEAARIPLITPRIEDNRVVNELTSNTDIEKIIFDRVVPHRKFVYCDSAFYAQPNRRLAIYYKQYKYIYNKATRTEELYDLQYDPNENCNIIADIIHDIDRNIDAPLRELYYYPNWDEVENIRTLLREEKNRIWREAPANRQIYENFKMFVRKTFPNFYEFLSEKVR